MTGCSLPDFILIKVSSTTGVKKEWAITELTPQQWAELTGVDGTHQLAIDLLESYK